jgi:hypothetical protein
MSIGGLNYGVRKLDYVEKLMADVGIKIGLCYWVK